MPNSSFSLQAEWRRLLGGCLLIGILSVASALLSNSLRSSPLPLLPPYLTGPSFASIRPSRAEEIVRSQGGVLLDSRYHSRYREGHLPQALSLPPRDFDLLFPLVQPLLSPQVLLIVYGEGRGWPSERELAYLLWRRGIAAERILILEGGAHAWQREGKPLVHRKRERG